MRGKRNTRRVIHHPRKENNNKELHQHKRALKSLMGTTREYHIIIIPFFAALSIVSTCFID
jgi:hypothetical protein